MVELATVLPLLVECGIDSRTHEQMVAEIPDQFVSLSDTSGRLSMTPVKACISTPYELDVPQMYRECTHGLVEGPHKRDENGRTLPLAPLRFRPSPESHVLDSHVVLFS